MIRRILTSVGLVAVGLLVSLLIGTALPGNNFVNAQTNRTAPARNNQLNAIDRQYVQDAGQASLAGISLGRLALQRSNNTAVKQFAQAEINEQVDVRNNLNRIAPKLGVTVPITPNAKNQALSARMSQLRGENFDKAFFQEAGINAHLENTAIYQREATFGQNQDLIGVANKGLPIISNHFNTASRLTNYRVAGLIQGINTPGTSGTVPQSNTVPQ
ncbi:hypothetical protein DSM106972_022210 [Dulcicalothrix desertica PCC 7102]|uniref:DUF4142 domain-containing protein n=1 Tax=Dulcicalothrix desertica PCC 7102 TaxID=232991 RepID=A0A3S1CPP6_9CYAN|nr:DUF4142 domain-containing protein [Dulcicalothrix desertica]RUT07961.1 hypothetical protein DSM106972_022210 [Dulcicalothrix desertica PCC 7102]TWH39482.1 putative membrane protein [Dulcicalothrix desertica PCC 7102]